METSIPPSEQDTKATSEPVAGGVASAGSRVEPEEGERQLSEYEERIRLYRQQVAEYEARKAQKTANLAHPPRRLRRACDVPQTALPEHSKLAPRIYAFFRLLVLVPLVAALLFAMLSSAEASLQGVHLALALYCLYPPCLALYLMGTEVKLTWQDLRHPSVNAPDSFTSLFRLPRDFVEICIYGVLVFFCKETLSGDNPISVCLLFAFSTILLLFQGCLISWSIPGDRGSGARREARTSLRLCLLIGTVVLSALFYAQFSDAIPAFMTE